MAEDYYELLGVSEDATTGEIKEAYRNRMKETHPDVSDDARASERTKLLIEAKDVLTDASDRKRYDRVGHEQFVNDRTTTSGTGHSQTESKATTNSRTQTEATWESPGWSDTTRTTQSTGQQSNTQTTGTTHGNTQGSNRTAGKTQEAGKRTQGSANSWYDPNSANQNGRHRRKVHQAWDSESPYAVGDDPEMFDIRELFGSQQAIVFLGTTFIIYPILLIGALAPAFPTAANITIAMCMVMVIAFLQSMPQVGIVVFGIWVVLLPIGMLGVVGLSPFSLFGVLALAAVIFPFCLSILSYIAINPNRVA